MRIKPGKQRHAHNHFNLSNLSNPTNLTNHFSRSNGPVARIFVAVGLGSPAAGSRTHP